jgi:hypothetical protein
MACVGNRSPQPQTEVSALRLLVVGDGRLILVTPSSGGYRELASSSLLHDVSALAFDPQEEVAYAIADSSSGPRLLRISPRSGEVVQIALIDLPPVSAGTADAMVFDPGSRQLLVAAGPKGLSNYLLSLDPQTGAATRMGRIRNTPQGELDGLVQVRGAFYAIDVVSEETYVYKFTPERILLESIGKLPGKVTDLAADPGSGRLFAAADGHLATLQIHGGLSLLPHSGALAVDALTVISSGATVFNDGFEGGDLAAWSALGKN